MSRLGALLAAERLEAARARWCVAWHMTRFREARAEVAKLKERSAGWRLAFRLAEAVAMARDWGEWESGWPEGPGRRPLAELAEREREMRS